MTAFVVDTNVILVANGQHQDVSAICLATCATKLQSIMRSEKLVVDDCFIILQEYQNKTTPKTGNRPGDAFVKWALRNNANTDRIDQVALQVHQERGFESFPDCPALKNFDPPDRVFVAVAAAHFQTPPILQAADSKWLDWTASLAHHNVNVEFLCRDDIERFQENKSKK